MARRNTRGSSYRRWATLALTALLLAAGILAAPASQAVQPVTVYAYNHAEGPPARLEIAIGVDFFLLGKPGVIGSSSSTTCDNNLRRRLCPLVHDADATIIVTPPPIP